MPLLMATLLLAFGCTPKPKPTVAGEAPSPDIAQLWSEPTDIAARDLFHGPGGPDLVPVPKSVFTFLAKDEKGFSPGYDVRDVPGRKWSVKYGPEAHGGSSAPTLPPMPLRPRDFAPSCRAGTPAARGPGRAIRSWGRSPTAA